MVIPYKDAIDKHIVIEWDGDYWHCNPEKHKTQTLTQSYIKERDRDKEEYLKDDYIILRFYESDLKDNVLSVKQKIWQALCNNPPTNNNNSIGYVTSPVLDEIKRTGLLTQSQSI